ncbi:type III pantothenate kinase [Sulfuricystis multivorans]|uniref:type III pantothenate kinase n=1 Tax=Sulfuricystis multivorans TaxID=2211108 RepID=UPI000F82508D|nr:type III pantothenate kinase [Sulfuricystis multivorans]
MILCIDAGNTRLKWGLHDRSRWLAKGVVAHEGIATLALPAPVQRVVACNVAGNAVAGQIEALARSLAAPLEWFVSSAACCGVTNGYGRPEQLGADRWAALIGARGLHAGPALVVMAGTATTVDALGADGRFLGGLILPGLELMRRTLARNTASLPEARGRYQELPTNTDDAIESGALHATLGAIERMAKAACRSTSAGFRVLLSGGAAEALAPHLDLPLRRIDDLVLEGLSRVAISSS